MAQLRSMTGFSSQQDENIGFSWIWEIRGVNHRSLDLRFRLPERLAGYEPALRDHLRARLKRGSISCNLRLQEDANGPQVPLSDSLAEAVRAVKEVASLAEKGGVALAPVQINDLIALRDLMVSKPTAIQASLAQLKPALEESFARALEAFCASRAAEGASLASVLSSQLARVKTLCARARSAANARQSDMAQLLTRQIADIMAKAETIPPDRLAQELALLAIKQDVTEELDRIETHIAAASTLLDRSGPHGRKLDFLMQEFNREASTLCAKSQSSDLIKIGLELKLVIDQMREQVQNVE